MLTMYAKCGRIDDARHVFDNMSERNVVSWDASSSTFSLLPTTMVKEETKELKQTKTRVGMVPGIYVGDRFEFRVELLIVSFHCSLQEGIDYCRHNSCDTLFKNRTFKHPNAKNINGAAGVLVSGGYKDNIGRGRYSYIQVMGKTGRDQMLHHGDLALKIVWNLGCL
ncbi:hypothetical protein SUGI_0368910 [Cryptomeria japonica]|nr:hypothetical protein SUGI_0368910 [Cryptomeria japonica]